MRISKRNLNEKCHQWLKTLCVDMTERTTGSQGNRDATKFFKYQMTSLYWATESKEFDAVDWKDGGATLHAGNKEFNVLVSPWSTGCSVRSNLESVSTVSELENGDFTNKIIFLHGDISREQLMPKNFVFYNPENHQKIISLLEKSGISPPGLLKSIRISPKVNPGPRAITAYFFNMADRPLQYPQSGLLKMSIVRILHTHRKTISGLLMIISLLNWLPH